MESEKHLALEYEAEREKQHCEEVHREEQKRQIERDFQKELKKIMEAEKVSHSGLPLLNMISCHKSSSYNRFRFW